MASFGGGKGLKMIVGDLITRLEAEGLLVQFDGDASKAVMEVSYDSRAVGKDYLFICKGKNFSQAYLDQAIEKGATCYMATKAYETGHDEVSTIIVREMRSAMAIVADWFFCSPWQALPVIGVTGTKGKSTTTLFLESIFDTYYYPRKVGMTSSLRVFDGVVDKVATLTTPENIDLFRYLASAREHHLPAMIVEVSSQALKYKRVGGLHFAHAVFLNIGSDHISPIEHPDFEDYFKSKLMIIDKTDKLYLNLNMQFIDRVREKAKGKPIVTFALNQVSDYMAYDIHTQAGQTYFRVKSKAWEETFSITVGGFFNVENALAAIAVASEVGVDVACIQKGLATCYLAGRMEVIAKTEKTPEVVIDYAHNKLSFESVLKEYYARGQKIWLVFGAPGGKAQNRRHELGEMASLYADEIILTADDPYDECAETIAQEIAEGFLSPRSYVFIEDRKEAIAYALAQAGADDVVLLLGKGAEKFQKMKSGNLAYEGDYYHAKFYLGKA